jgi:hypothetical protein
MKTVTVYPCNDGTHGWAVEYVAPEDDGRCDKALFFGDDAKGQAERFALNEWPTLSADRPGPKEPKMSETMRYSPKDLGPKPETAKWTYEVDCTANPTFAELRAKVTEAEAAYGRAVYEGRHWSHAEYVRRVAPLESAMIDAREALRKAEEEAKRPRLASVGTIQRQAGRRAIADWDTALIVETRGDMVAAMRDLPVRLMVGPEGSGSALVALSDIEALVREAGE